MELEEKIISLSMQYVNHSYLHLQPGGVPGQIPVYDQAEVQKCASCCPVCGQPSLHFSTMNNDMAAQAALKDAGTNSTSLQK